MKPASEQPSLATLQMWFDSGIDLYVTDKFDGIRGVVMQTGMKSASLELIPNRYIQEYTHEFIPIGFDGEIMVPGGYNAVQSEIMSRDGTPDFTFHVFDDFTYAHLSYLERIERLRFQFPPNRVKFEFPRRVFNMGDLEMEEENALSRGREGLIMRVGWGQYKYGRSTILEALALKLKRWQDDEATIIAVNPLMRNDNNPIINELGLQERGHGIEGKTALEMVGSYTVEHPKWGIFNVGTPMTKQERINRWSTRYTDIGSKLTFSFIPHGTQARPRHPKIKYIARLDQP